MNYTRDDARLRGDQNGRAERTSTVTALSKRLRELAERLKHRAMIRAAADGERDKKADADAQTIEDAIAAIDAARAQGLREAAAVCFKVAAGAKSVPHSSAKQVSMTAEDMGKAILALLPAETKP